MDFERWGVCGLNYFDFFSDFTLTITKYANAAIITIIESHPPMSINNPDLKQDNPPGISISFLHKDKYIVRPIAPGIRSNKDQIPFILMK